MQIISFKKHLIIIDLMNYNTYKYSDCKVTKIGELIVAFCQSSLSIVLFLWLLYFQPIYTFTKFPIGLQRDAHKKRLTKSGDRISEWKS